MSRSILKRPAVNRTILEAVGAAKPLPDPLTNLIERTKADAGAPFEPAPVDALREMRKGRRSDYERLLSRLKSEAGFRKVTELEKEVRRRDDDGRPPNQAGLLIELGEQDVELFHTPGADPEAYADITIDGRRMTVKVRSKHFRRRLLNLYFDGTGSAPDREASNNAIATLEAKAIRQGPEHAVYLRVAPGYIDLGDDSWRAVRVNKEGWAVVTAPKPIRFRRSDSAMALPRPERVDDPREAIMELFKFINVKSRNDRILVIAWLLAALHSSGPYPVLVVTGEHGSAKSTCLKILRLLVDPQDEDLPGLPGNLRDLFVRASNRHGFVVDNIDEFPSWASSAVCRISYGASHSVRELYSDGAEHMIRAYCPIILNGIEDFATRGDLVSRAILITLEPISEEDRRDEKELLALFEEARPRILGALLDAMVEGYRNLPSTKLDRLPRMADFAKWAVACESAFWPNGTFMAAYDQNRDATVDWLLAADSVATAVRRLMADDPNWEGTWEQLLYALSRFADEHAPRRRGWPDTPGALSGKLRRSADALRRHGIDFEITRRGKKKTTWVIISRTEPAERSRADDGAAPIRAEMPARAERDTEPPPKVNGHRISDFKYVRDPELIRRRAEGRAASSPRVEREDG